MKTAAFFDVQRIAESVAVLYMNGFVNPLYVLEFKRQLTIDNSTQLAEL